MAFRNKQGFTVNKFSKLVLYRPQKTENPLLYETAMFEKLLSIPDTAGRRDWNRFLWHDR